nr:YbaB/EbfC family nucleoid-associated protein [Nocardia bovistercoris]
MDELMDSVRRRLYRIRDLAEDMAGVRATETAPGGAMTAEVDGNGALLSLHFSREVSRMSPEQFERCLVETTHAAARRAFERRGELVNAFNEEVAE